MQWGGWSQGFIVIGNESKGIRAGLLELATDRVTIPGAGRAESLNAAVAGGDCSFLTWSDAVSGTGSRVPAELFG